MSAVILISPPRRNPLSVFIVQVLKIDKAGLLNIRGLRAGKIRGLVVSEAQ